MASRSFKPASYLASARPTYSRSSSASSILSVKSDDFLSTRLRSLTPSTTNTATTTTTTTDHDTEFTVSASPSGKNNIGASNLRHEVDRKLQSENIVPGCGSTGGSKGSRPIAIEMPQNRQPAAYTPLTARGELIGGYFPFHEDTTTTKVYESKNKTMSKNNSLFLQSLSRSHSNHNHKTAYSHARYMYSHSRASSTASSPSGMSNTSSALPSPAENTATIPPSSMLSSPFSIADSISLTLPLGKYHPSKYISPSTTPNNPSAPHSASTSTSGLAFLPSSSQRSPVTQIDRRGEDVTAKLHDYQREMIKQARRAARRGFHGEVRSGEGGGVEPGSPTLEPLRSPGPITPFVLEIDGNETGDWLGMRTDELKRTEDGGRSGKGAEEGSYAGC